MLLNLPSKIIDAVEKLYLLPSMGRKVSETDDDRISIVSAVLLVGEATAAIAS